MSDKSGFTRSNRDICNSDTKRQKFKNFSITYVLSVIAACAAELCTYPFDLTKTRLQIQGELAIENKKTEYRGMIRTAYGIATEEGPLRLWQGITPALMRHVIYSGCRVVFYEWLRKGVFGAQPKDQVALWKSTICGVVAGASAQFLASPADLVKVQMQMEGRRKLMGLPPRVLTASAQFRLIVREGGVRGLWKGGGPNAFRAAMVNVGDLTTYDACKHWLVGAAGLRDGPPAHAVAAGMAGLAAAALATPADVIKTRLMNQPTGDRGRGLAYKSSVDCLRKTVSNEGLAALYKGFVPVWIRMGPWAFIFWVSNEKLRKAVGIEQF